MMAISPRVLGLGQAKKIGSRKVREGRKESMSLDSGLARRTLSDLCVLSARHKTTSTPPANVQALRWHPLPMARTFFRI